MPLVTKTYTGVKLEPYMRPNDAVTESWPFGNSLTVTKGTVIAITTATGKGAAYSDAGSGGAEIAKAIAMYDFTTDGSGNVTIGGDSGATYKSAPVYVGGYF